MDILLVPEDVRYFRGRIITWGRQHFADFPWRKTANRWHALAAEIMLQRTRAEQVLPAFTTFTRQYASPCDYATGSTPSAFASLGLFWREKHLTRLASALCRTDIPEDKESLLRLPGVGDYVASAYLSLHAGKREPIIDSNVVRLYGRFFGFGTDGETRRNAGMRHLAERLTPKRAFKSYNYGIIDLTRSVCMLRPVHESCPLKGRCHMARTPR